MNSVCLNGRLVRDPEVKASEKVITKFTLAVDRQFKNANGERETDFISCVCFGKVAEIAGNNLSKGSFIGVVGSIRTGNYENKEGKKVYTFDINVSELQFLDSKKNSNTTSANSNTEFDAVPVNDDFVPF